MRPWRKVHASFLDSSDVAELSDSATLLFLFLIVAQDDSGYYPTDPARLRRITVTRPDWSRDATVSLLQDLEHRRLLTFVDGGVLLTNGQKYNGRLRKDVDAELYSRTRDVDATLTPRIRHTLQESVTNNNEVKADTPAQHNVDATYLT